MSLDTTAGTAMLKFNNDSDTVIVVLHEIYGINEHITMVGGDLALAGLAVVCPDLLNLGNPFSYDHEPEAYQYFLNNVGFAKAAELVTDLLREVRERYRRVILLGFSIGATTGWLVSGAVADCDGFIGFYGSRIRDYLYVAPKYPVLLFLPLAETSFKTEELAVKLVNKENVTVQILEGGHGFADPFSRNYHEKSCRTAWEMVMNFIAQIQK